jgi:SAM-dependent methyltransferase
MLPESAYEHETRDAYRTRARAASYKRRQAVDWTWARFATWREQSVVATLAARGGLGRGATVLDVPCGTGILGPTAQQGGWTVVASDISREMIALARDEYRGGAFRGFVEADILSLPLGSKAVDGAVVLGFFHRVPSAIRRAALVQLSRIVRGAIVATCSVDGPFQQLKGAVLSRCLRDYAAAPHRATLSAVESDCAAAGLEIVEVRRPVPLLSSNIVLLLRHRENGRVS